MLAYLLHLKPQGRAQEKLPNIFNDLPYVKALLTKLYPQRSRCLLTARLLLALAFKAMEAILSPFCKALLNSSTVGHVAPALMDSEHPEQLVAVP